MATISVLSRRHVHSEGWTSVTFTDAGDLLTCGADGDVCVMDSNNLRKEERRMNISPNARALVAKSLRFFVASDELYVNSYMIGDGNLDYEIFRFTAEVTFITLQQRLLVAGAANFQIRCVELEVDLSDIGDSFLLEGHTAPILSVAVDTKCRHIASSSCDGSVRLWDIASHAQVAVKTGLFARHSDIDEKEPLVVIDFNPVTCELAVPTLKQLHVYGVGVLGEPAFILSVPTERTASGARFSPDGNMLLVFDNGSSVFLFLTESQTHFKTLSFGAPIISAAWNTTSTAVALADYDGNIAVCDEPFSSTRASGSATKATVGSTGLTQFFVDTQLDESQLEVGETATSSAEVQLSIRNDDEPAEIAKMKLVGHGKNGKWTHADDEMLNRGVEEIFEHMDKEFGGGIGDDKNVDKKIKRLKGNALGLETKKPGSPAFVSGRAKGPKSIFDKNNDLENDTAIAGDDDDDIDVDEVNARERDYEIFNQTGLRNNTASTAVADDGVPSRSSTLLERKVSDQSTTSTQSKSTATAVPLATVLGAKAHAIELPKLQAPFQPGSTPTYQSQRFMKWNALGTVTSFYTDEEKSIHIRYHDVTHLPTQKYNNNDKFFKLADLGETYVALASERIEDEDDGDDDDDKTRLDDELPRRKISPACLRICSMRRTDEVKQWEFVMPNDENIEGLCCGAGWIACTTSRRCLRIFSEGGMQRAVLSLPCPFLCMNGCGRNLLVVMHASPPHADGEPCLTFSLYSISESSITVASQGERVAISAHTQLYWAGFTDEGSPAAVDTDGWVRVYKTSLVGQPSSQWMPVLNTKAKQRKVDHYFVVSISENQREVRAIFCRGSKYPAAVPRPEVAALKMELPLCTIGGAVDRDVAAVAAIESDMLFNYMFPPSTLLLAANNSSTQSSDTILSQAWSIRNEKALTAMVLRYVAAACQANRPQRALDAAMMITDPSLVEQVCRFVARMGQAQLTKALTDRAEMLYEVKSSGIAAAMSQHSNSAPASSTAAVQNNTQNGAHANDVGGRVSNMNFLRAPQQSFIATASAKTAAAADTRRTNNNYNNNSGLHGSRSCQAAMSRGAGSGSLFAKTSAAAAVDYGDDSGLYIAETQLPSNGRSGTQDVLSSTTPLKTRNTFLDHADRNKRAKFP